MGGDELSGSGDALVELMPEVERCVARIEAAGPLVSVEVVGARVVALGADGRVSAWRIEGAELCWSVEAQVGAARVVGAASGRAVWCFGEGVAARLLALEDGASVVEVADDASLCVVMGADEVMVVSAAGDMSRWREDGSCVVAAARYEGARVVAACEVAGGVMLGREDGLVELLDLGVRQLGGSWRWPNLGTSLRLLDVQRVDATRHVVRVLCEEERWVVEHVTSGPELMRCLVARELDPSRGWLEEVGVSEALLARDADQTLHVSYTVGALELRVAGRLKARYFGHGAALVDARFIEGQRAISVDAADEIRCWRLDLEEELPRYVEARELHLLEDGRSVAATSPRDGSAIWRADIGLVHSSASAGALALHVERDVWTRLRSGSPYHHLDTFSVEQGAPYHPTSSVVGKLMGATLSSDGREVVGRVTRYRIALYELPSGARRCYLDGHLDTIVQVWELPQVGRLLSASQDRTARVWDVERAELLATHALPAVGILTDASLAASGEALLLANGAAPTAFALTEGAQLGAQPRSDLREVSFSPDGVWRAAMVYPGVLELTDQRAHTTRKTAIKAKWGEYSPPRFLLDGTLLLAEGTKIMRWDVHTDELLHTYKGLTRKPYELLAHPDARRFVSLDEHRVCVWDLESGELLATVKGAKPSWWSRPQFLRDGSLFVPGRGRVDDG
jgi:WD40 repeat protein